MFCIMVSGLIQESAAELHYTLQEARLGALELVEDPTGEQMMAPRLPFVNASPTERSRSWDVWSLEADSDKNPNSQGDEHDSE